MGIHPGTNEQAILSAAPELHAIPFDLQAFQDRTDRDGKFAFTDVPPGTWLISHGSEPPWDGDSVTIKAGETNHVTIGGTGRPVVGKLLIPASLTNGPAHPRVVTTRAQLEVRDSTTPGPTHTISVTLYADRKEVHAKLESDGTFRLDDATPGRWWLLAQIIQFPIGWRVAKRSGPLAGRLSFPKFPEAAAISRWIWGRWSRRWRIPRKSAKPPRCLK